MDDITKAQRTLCMSKIHSQNTAIEVRLRKWLWNNGIKGYRIKNRHILGKPDIYFGKKQIAVFIDGCYWHSCPICKLHSKSNKGYWLKKLAGNSVRDRKINQSLRAQGIKVVRIWEHEIKQNLETACKSLIYKLN